MLNLTRKKGTAIIINGNIRVEVRGVNGGQVKLGISAPRGVTVNREEIQKRIDGEKNGQPD